MIEQTINIQHEIPTRNLAKDVFLVQFSLYH